MRLERDDVLPVGQHHAPDRDLVHLADGFADDGEGVVADLAVRHQVVGTDQISRIDLAAVDELVDLDGSRRFQRDVLELLLRHLDEGVGVDLVALDDVLVGDLLAGVGVHLGVLDAVAGLPVELVERDLFGFRRGRIERYRTGDEGKTQEAFPVSAGGHDGGTPILMLDSRRMARLGSDIATFPTGGFFHGAGSIGLDFCSLYVLIRNDRPTRELAHADPKADGKAGR